MVQRNRPLAAIACALAGAGAIAVAVAPAVNAQNAAAPRLQLLTDPFLQVPTKDSVTVVWMTEFRGSEHTVEVGDSRVVRATTTKLSQVGEDSGSQLPPEKKPTAAQGIVARDVYRHEAKITGLKPGERVPYQVTSLDDSGGYAQSNTFSLSAAPKKGQPQRILLTSDHQAMVNTPANLELAAKTLGPIDAVFVAGDLINIPDRASEWFDDTRGSAFFPVLQGRGGRNSTHGEHYRGGEIIQNAPLFPAIGNHEVQGIRAGATSLNASFNAPVPKKIAERAYSAVEASVNPRKDPAVKAKWIEDNSFSTRTYEEIFTLPEDSPGGETYYATTLGDVRVISLYSTRIWRGTNANTLPADRTASSRYQESKDVLADNMKQGWGEHIFEPVSAESEQLEWLRGELKSKAFKDARFRVVILHEGPQGLGDNIMPVFADPVRIEERTAAGALEGIRYEYPATENDLLNDLQPMLEDAGVDLVQNGHSHLWNRFRSAGGTNFIETSNTGNTYGAFHHLSGRTRPLPPAPWIGANYMAQGNPGGLAPIVPTVNPMKAGNGVAMPFVQSNDHAVFTVLDTGLNEVISYIYDVRSPELAPKVLDRFSIGRPADKAELVDQPAAPVPAPSADPTPAPAVPAPKVSAAVRTTTYGVGAEIDVRVEGAADGPVDVLAGSRALATARLTDGAAKVKLQGTALKPGRHTLTVKLGGVSSTVDLRVDRATAAVKTKTLSSKRSRARVQVTVSAAGLAPSGTVKLREGSRIVGSAKVRSGKATVTLRAFTTAGTKRLKLSYSGGATVSERSATLRLKVR